MSESYNTRSYQHYRILERISSDESTARGSTKKRTVNFDEGVGISQSIFTPAIGSRSCLVMSKVVPGVTVVALIFAYRPPLALAEAGPHFFHGMPCPRASSSFASLP